MTRLLMERGLTEEVAKATAQTILDTRATQAATVSNNIFATSVNYAKTALQGLGNVIKAHPIMAIITAVTILISVIGQLKQKAEDAAKEAMKNAVDAANSFEDSLKNIDSYITKIDELKEALNKDDISQSEATEKRKELLKIQEELIKKYGQEKDVVDSITEAIQGETTALNNLQIASAKNYLKNNRDKIKEAYDYFNNSKEEQIKIPYNPSKYIYGNGSTVYWNVVVPILKSELDFKDVDTTNDEGAVFKGTNDELIAQYDKLNNEIQKYLDTHPISDPNSDLYTEHGWVISSSDVHAVLNDYLDEISKARAKIVNDENYDKYKQIYDNGVEALVMTNDKYSEYYNKLIEAKNKYAQALASGSQEEIIKTYTELQDIFREIFNLDFLDEDNVSGDSIKNWFENVRNQTELLSKETPIIIDVQIALKTKPDGDPIAGIKDLIQEKDYTADDISNIMKNGDSGLELSEDDKKIYNALKSYVTTWNEVAEATGQATIEYEDLIGVLVKLGVVKANVFKNEDGSSFALSKDQTKELKAVYSDVEKLNNAYQKLMSGKLTSNEVAELVSLFPELGEYVDWTDEKFGNLSEGIDKVIKERPAELIEQLEGVLNTQNLSDDAKKSIQSIIAALKLLKPELKDVKTFIEEIQKTIKGVSGSISTLIGFTKEITSDGVLSLSSIDTILTDDTYKSLRPYINDMEGMQTAIDELVAKQKDAYEDLYNAEMYENDYEAYRAELDKKEAQGEEYLSNSVKDIQNEIKDIEQQYDVDLTNWDNLSETKKTMLQNTNAELLSKQASLINTFKSYYDTDLTNYKNTTEAKAAILENFRKSEAFAQATKIAIENDALGNDYGRIYLADKDGNIKNKINSILSSSGLTWEDYIQYLNNGTFTSKGNETLQKNLDEIVKAYKLTPTDWNNITANIKSTGGSKSSSSSSKNYIDWIERRLKKFAQTTKEVFAKVADYISFNSQNSQLRKSINAIRDEIAVNERAYQAYMNEANKLGLGSDWRAWIQNGGYSIQDISNLSDSLKDKISRYKELYDQAIDCKNAVEDLKKTEKEYANQMLSNIEKYYSNRINYANSGVEYYNSLDTDNLYVSKNYNMIRESYKSQILYTQSERSNLVSTLNSLVSSGIIKQFDDDWYEWQQKINDCDVSVRNLQKSIRDLASEQFNNIQTNYENKLKQIEHTAKEYENTNQIVEERGYLATTKYYEALQKTETNNLITLKKQAESLEKSLNNAVKSGDIQKYSNEWYNMRDAINSVNESIDESNLKLINYANTIREIGWQTFDYIQERIERINTEASFLIDLMSNSKLFDDNGNITSQGKSVMGLHIQNYNQYKQQAKEYAEEIKRINAQLAKDNNNTDIIKRREELLSLQQKSIKAANDEKKAIIDLTKEGFDAQLKSLKELIDQYTKSLDSAKSLYEYQDTINNKTSNIAKLQKQLMAYSGDYSEETQAKIQKLQVDLQDAQKDLEKTEYEKFISDTKSLLNDLYDDYEETLNNKLDDIDGIMSDMISVVDITKSEISETITNSASQVGYTLSSEIRNIWNNSGKVSDKVIGVLDTINSNVANMVATSGGTAAIKKYASGGLVNYTGIARVDGSFSKPEAFLSAGDTENIANLRDTLRELASKPLTLANGYGTAGLLGGTITPNILDLSKKLQALSGDISQNVNIHNENHIEIGIDKVEDYNDFISKMQKDRKFENIIQDMTFGRMNGGSSLAKYRH